MSEANDQAQAGEGGVEPDHAWASDTPRSTETVARRPRVPKSRSTASATIRPESITMGTPPPGWELAPTW